MFRNNKELSEKYFPILERLFGFKKRIKLIEVDFEKPWYNALEKEKIRLGFTFLGEIVHRVFVSVMPIIVGLIIVEKSINLFFLLALVYLFTCALYLFYMYNYCIATANIMNGVFASASKFFLVVDPLFHTTRSSGKIIAKVNRSSEAVETILDLLVFDLVGAVAGILAVVVVMCGINLQIGLLAGFFVIAIVLLSMFIQIVRVNITSVAQIKQDDKLKAVSVETLQQAAHIRSTFASNEQLNKIITLSHRLAQTLATHWFTSIFSSLFIRAVFVISFIIIGVLTIQSVQNNTINSTLAVSILISYLSSSAQILNIGRSVEIFTDRVVRISDLFEFIQGFGKQTYPVLEGDTLSALQGHSSEEGQNLTKLKV